MTTFPDWTIDFSSGIPAYRQIMNLLFFEMGKGTLREGDRLPTIKELAERLKVNPNTVAKAYREMDLKGGDSKPARRWFFRGGLVESRDSINTGAEESKAWTSCLDE